MVLEENLNAVYNWHKSIDEILRFTYLDNVIIKPNAVVRYSTRVAKKKNYNAKSLANLVQFDGPKDKALENIRKQEKVENINEWAKEYLI